MFYNLLLFQNFFNVCTYICTHSAVCVCIFFFFFFYFRATPAAYGSSQARGPIGAATSSHSHSHSSLGSELRLQATPELTAMLHP